MASPNDPLLDLGSRRRVYRYVEENPGMHLRGIQRGLDMPLGTVEYHLHQMEKNGLLVVRDDGRFKAFFAKEGVDRRDKDILYYVRQENPRRIMIHLLENPGASHSAIVAALPVGPSTVSFHLNKLVKAGRVTQQRQGRSKLFFVEDAERTAGVLVRYRKSFLDDLVDRFVGSWVGLTPPEGEQEEEESGDEGDRGEPMPGEHAADRPFTPEVEAGPEGETSDEKSSARPRPGPVETHSRPLDSLLHRILCGLNRLVNPFADAACIPQAGS